MDKFVNYEGRRAVTVDYNLLKMHSYQYEMYANALKRLEQEKRFVVRMKPRSIGITTIMAPVWAAQLAMQGRILVDANGKRIEPDKRAMELFCRRRFRELSGEGWRDSPEPPPKRMGLAGSIALVPELQRVGKDYTCVDANESIRLGGSDGNVLERKTLPTGRLYGIDISQGPDIGFSYLSVRRSNVFGDDGVALYNKER